MCLCLWVAEDREKEKNHSIMSFTSSTNQFRALPELLSTSPALGPPMQTSERCVAMMTASNTDSSLTVRKTVLFTRCLLSPLRDDNILVIL